MNKIKNIIQNKFDIVSIAILFIVCLFIFQPLIPKHYFWGMDSFYHYSNIFALLETIDFSSLHILPGKIYPIIAYDFGWPSGIFYPSFPHHITAYLHLLLSLVGVSNIFTTMKIAHFGVLFLSGILMYILANKIFKNKVAGLISAILYITFPYQYIDIFSRDAFAECFMFATIPLVFLGLIYLINGDNKKFYIYFIIGYVLSMNCHLVLSVYLTIFVLIFLLINIKKIWNKNNIKALFISAGLILLLTSPFIIPLCAHTIFGNYAVYIDGFMIDKDVITHTIVHFKDYFSLEKPAAWFGEVVPTISFSALFCFIIILIRFKKVKEITGLWSYIILSVLIVIIMSPIIPWTKLPSFLLQIQFVWRLNVFFAFFMSLSAGFVAILFNKKWLKYGVVIIAILMALAQIYTFRSMLIIKDFDVNTLDIDKHGRAACQYIPAKSYKNLDYVKTRGTDVIVKKGKANIKIINNNTPYLEFEINDNKNIVELELPRYYYLGYDITFNDKKIKYKENSKGFIEIKVKGEGKVTVKYKGGIYHYISLILFGIGVLISIVYLVRTKTNLKETATVKTKTKKQKKHNSKS